MALLKYASLFWSMKCIWNITDEFAWQNVQLCLVMLEVNVMEPEMGAIVVVFAVSTWAWLNKAQLGDRKV